jgi:hypothetical protein
MILNGNEPGEAKRLFTTIATIGPELAQRIHEHLGVETLAELYAAARDGRLAQVPGIGPKRLRAVREAVTARAGRSTGEPKRQRQLENPKSAPEENNLPIDVLLAIDREYRELAAKDQLPKIAPKRFNPTGESWLPVLHAEREGKHFTALFSNTARAHELGADKDWVVIYHDRPPRERWTVVTGLFGRLRGQRIVRGREKECVEYYAFRTRSPNDEAGASSP